MRQLVIFAFYLNIDNMSHQRAYEYAAQVKRSVDDLICEEDQSLYNLRITWLVIPVKNQETKVECIYPALYNISNESIQLIDKLKEEIKIKI